jgi:hypothetical protein
MKHYHFIWVVKCFNRSVIPAKLCFGTEQTEALSAMEVMHYGKRRMDG